MTFTLPDDLAHQFIKKVAARNRSRYLAQALAQRLQERDRQLFRACEVANRHPKVKAIEKEFDALSEEFREPWNDAEALRGVVGAGNNE
jgi:ubiquinone biosynthesis protein UbiJ